MFIPLSTYEDESEWISTSLRLITTTLQNHPQPLIALAGGKTPVPIYEAMQGHQELLRNTHWIQTDERIGETEEKNRIMQEHALGSLLTNTNFHPLPLSAHDNVSPYYNEQPTISIIGCGSDGHIASLFPHHINQIEHGLLWTTVPSTGAKRVSLTLPHIMSSELVLLLIRGKEKEEGLLKWKDSNPLKTILTHPHLHILFLL